jgi:hypothetical protein
MKSAITMTETRKQLQAIEDPRGEDRWVNSLIYHIF